MSLTLSAEELQELTGYRQPGAQLEALKKQGFYRARRNAAGAVVLERAHFEAVCAGRDIEVKIDQPQLRIPRLRRAA